MAFSSLPWFQVWRYEGAVVLYADNHTRTQKTARLACWVPSFSFILPLGWAHFYAPIKRIERLQFTGFFFVCLFVFLWRCAVPVGAIRSIDFDRFRLKMSFDWVLPSFHTEQILPAKMTAIKGENTCELGFFFKFYRVLPDYSGFYWVLPSFTGFYWVLLGLRVLRLDDSIDRGAAFLLGPCQRSTVFVPRKNGINQRSTDRSLYRVLPSF